MAVLSNASKLFSVQPYPIVLLLHVQLLPCFRVWSVCYNRFHDQLVLSSSSDSRVILNNIISLSSEPYGHLIENDEDDDDDDVEGRDSRYHH